MIMGLKISDYNLFPIFTAIMGVLAIQSPVYLIIRSKEIVIELKGLKVTIKTLHNVVSYI